MAYKNKTNFYRIPVMGKGDVMTEEQNWKQMSIVDNLLYAATFGCSQCFLQQGNYQVQINASGNSCYLFISPYEQNGFSLMGILNYRMFYSKDVKKLGPLYRGLRYYIYIEYHDIMETNPTGFSLTSYTEKQDANEYRMLLCILELADEPILNLDVNKVYSKNILAHTKDNTNPHGVVLYQENLQVNNKLLLHGYNVNSSFYTSYTTNAQGVYNMQSPQNMQIVFATAYPESNDVGNISWEIVNNNICFYNSKIKQGVKVNVKLDLRRKNNDL